MRTCIWITGLAGTGKTTLAYAIADLRPDVVILDADQVRATFWPDLGFPAKDRRANVIRLGLMASQLVRQGADVIVTAVSPDAGPRKEARALIELDGIYRSVLLTCKPPRKEPWKGTVYEWGNTDMEFATETIEPGLMAKQVVKKFLSLPKRAMFIGRWQGFHKGHEKIIREALAKGPVAIGVRDTERGPQNPLSVAARVHMIRVAFKGEDVVVFGCPDLSDIHIGRDVGYGVVQHDEVPGVSGTAERKKLGL